ncbi:MAG: segregation/condensation protein A [SAR324 cluster bacterium]|jgi:segregation and condensation protein A|nr:segregation/condensation protein A [SAR324 cluster bacterium]MCH2265508.1 segregation/condensation protein A [SAR324 cluster bacterium]
METMEDQHKNVELSTIFPNPENPLEIKIPLFEGPLDLLLHLIRKKEVSIAEVRLSELTASYLEYLEKLQSINLDLAGEFLEIAAMLILIKSRSLLPKSPVDIEEFEEEDPEEILRRRLLEYQHYKNAAFELGSLDILGRDVFQRPENVELVSDTEEADPEYEDISVSALMEAFERVMRRLPKINRYVIETESVRIEDRIDELIARFAEQPHCLFEELFQRDKPRIWFIITFMSILEMVRLHIITIVQVDQLAAIHCTAHENFEKNIIYWYNLQNIDEDVEEALLKAS